MCQEHAVARLRPALGTLVAIEARAKDPVTASQAVEAGFEIILAAEARLHPRRAGSDLARLNQASAGRRLQVHHWTAAILELCRQLHTLSGGRFDPALPGSGSIMDWLPAGPSAVFVRRRTRVDLGGIAKGYAVDLATMAMRRAGASGGLVNAGGDLRVFGGALWPVVLRVGAPATLVLELRDCALAASDAHGNNRPREHEGYYAGGQRGRRAVAGAAAITAPTAALADALSKVMMFTPPMQSARILARCGARTVTSLPWAPRTP